MAIVEEKYPFIKNGEGVTNAAGRFDVVFDAPYNNGNYAVMLTLEQVAGICAFWNRTATGFRVGAADTSGAPLVGETVNWTTIKYVNG